MTEPQTSKRPPILPMLAYEDGPAAIDWLCTAFGFTENFRMVGDDGRVGHAELQLGDAVISLATPSPDYQSPKHHAETCAAARKWQEVPWVINGLVVYVDDVDAHAGRARAAGARLLSEPEDSDHGDRLYRVEDLEGQRWMFATPIAS
jgi:uncharacterized glyoxalase superfamily protein PhnB